MTKHQSFSAEYVVQSNLDCYNNRDIEGFMEAYHSDIMYLNYETKNIMLNGLEQVRDNYIRLFDASPNLNSTIINRICYENIVIDHESITGRNGCKDVLELVLIYEIKENKIIKVTVIKK